MPNSSTSEFSTFFFCFTLVSFHIHNIVLPSASKFFILSIAYNWDIMIQVHDELVLEVDPSYVKLAVMLLQTSMENAVSLLGMFLIY